MTNNDLSLIEDVEIRQPDDIAKMDDELHCPNVVRRSSVGCGCTPRGTRS